MARIYVVKGLQEEYKMLRGKTWIEENIASFKSLKDAKRYLKELVAELNFNSKMNNNDNHIFEKNDGYFEDDYMTYTCIDYDDWIFKHCYTHLTIEPLDYVS